MAKVKSRLRKITKKQKITLCVIVAVFILFDLSPFGGNIAFYSKWVACGQRPVKAAGFVIEGVRYYEASPIFEPVRFGYETYFCTPLQAEQAGYSASPHQYEFKYLPKDQWDDARANLGR